MPRPEPQVGGHVPERVNQFNPALTPLDIPPGPISNQALTEAIEYVAKRAPSAVAALVKRSTPPNGSLYATTQPERAGLIAALRELAHV